MEMREGIEGLEPLLYGPDGKPFPAVPRTPTVPADATADLVHRNRLGGVDPDSWTATPRWNGEALDLGLAIDMLSGLEGGG